jgi:hypothetical protein
LGQSEGGGGGSGIAWVVVSTFVPLSS